jgi:hypothetical protein
MKREDDNELWDLLGKSSEPTLSPFFARNVLRQVREEKGWRDAAFNWLRPRLLVPSAAVAVGVVAALLTFVKPASDTGSPAGTTMASEATTGEDLSSGEELPPMVAQVDPQDFEVVADLDNLLAFEEEESLWEDT